MNLLLILAIVIIILGFVVYGIREDLHFKSRLKDTEEENEKKD